MLCSTTYSYTLWLKLVIDWGWPKIFEVHLFLVHLFVAELPTFVVDDWFFFSSRPGEKNRPWLWFSVIKMIKTLLNLLYKKYKHPWEVCILGLMLCLWAVWYVGLFVVFFSDEYWQNHPELHDIPIYYASSLAKKCMAVYQTYVNAMNDKIRKQININNPFVFKHISNLKVRLSYNRGRMMEEFIFAE